FRGRRLDGVVCPAHPERSHLHQSPSLVRGRPGRERADHFGPCLLHQLVLARYLKQNTKKQKITIALRALLSAVLWAAGNGAIYAVDPALTAGNPVSVGATTTF